MILAYLTQARSELDFESRRLLYADLRRRIDRIEANERRHPGR
jgi:hypothetical protein